ncbi:hypothetical protein WJX72_003137 [[Myrmecia] bisecta]|uniref:NADP-dependent oxidoreductase domain-containing protein n=1 Tax=[Myrmecia] bisecta TaxID=41462 RepID=A0AAW1PXH2_9CHLO
MEASAGYRHIDCASTYNNEAQIGEALSPAINAGLVVRRDIFVTSKLWNTDHATARVRQACLKSLKELQLDFLDLYLMHWPVSGNRGPTVEPGIRETWEAMQSLVDEGFVRSIGVSNFSIKKMQDILAYTRLPLSVCQVEIHPYHRNDQLIAWCRSQGVHVTAYSPLGSPDSATMFKREAPVLLQDPVLARIAASLGKSPAQVLIRWALQHGTSVLPKSTSPARIQANLEVFDWHMPADDFAELSALQPQMRMVDGSFWLHPAGPYKTLQDFWNE